VIIERWRRHYNTIRPHSSLGYKPPADIGAALEQAAESADTDASRKWVGELSRYLDRVEIIFD